MKNFFLNFFKTIFDSQKGQRFLEKVHLFVLYLQNYGLSGECDTSGEENAMKIIASKINSKSNVIVFDVGANIGKYTNSFVTFLKTNYTIHCFEPLESTFDILKKNTETNKNIVSHCVGLGDKTEETVIYSNEKTNTQSSLIPRDMSHWGNEYNLSTPNKISITTVDEFCGKNSISFIDFLKVDVEGFEWLFFKGAKQTLDSKKIGIIQFELGVCAVDGKYFFKDIFYLLSPNYKIYRITKNNLYEIKAYKEQYEIFLTTNYVAILK
ncbi:MAG: FkbM family methyltransferase [Bacteroidia bacterium]|nr:FkbM family methyltransferase [Bacteroidia bacterium]